VRIRQPRRYGTGTAELHPRSPGVEAGSRRRRLWICARYTAGRCPRIRTDRATGRSGGHAIFRALVVKQWSAPDRCVLAG
jgi:hypothetical protein